MLITMPTAKTVEQASAALQEAAKANGFGVLHVHDLKETLEKKGIGFPHECLIFEVCQPQQAKRVLEKNMGASTALPCRISVYEQDGKTFLATLAPAELIGMFDAPELIGVAREVEDSIVKIMKETALS